MGSVFDVAVDNTQWGSPAIMLQWRLAPKHDPGLLWSDPPLSIAWPLSTHDMHPMLARSERLFSYEPSGARTILHFSDHPVAIGYSRPKRRRFEVSSTAGGRRSMAACWSAHSVLAHGVLIQVTDIK